MSQTETTPPRHQPDGPHPLGRCRRTHPRDHQMGEPSRLARQVSQVPRLRPPRRQRHGSAGAVGSGFARERRENRHACTGNSPPTCKYRSGSVCKVSAVSGRRSAVPVEAGRRANGHGRHAPGKLLSLARPSAMPCLWLSASPWPPLEETEVEFPCSYPYRRLGVQPTCLHSEVA